MIHSMTTTATPPATAEDLYAEGMSLLDSGDTQAASETLWAAAATAMEAYAKERGWVPDGRRLFIDVARLRTEELGFPFGDPYTPTPVDGPFSAAETLEANAWEHGQLLTKEEVRRLAEEMRELFEIFCVDS